MISKGQSVRGLGQNLGNWVLGTNQIGCIQLKNWRIDIKYFSVFLNFLGLSASEIKKTLRHLCTDHKRGQMSLKQLITLPIFSHNL